MEFEKKKKNVTNLADEFVKVPKQRNVISTNVAFFASSLQ